MFRKKVEDEIDVKCKNTKKEIISERNKFSFSLGIVIVVIGILSFFLDCSNNVLIGVSISSLLFSIINCFFNENSKMQIIPLLVLMTFLIYPEGIEKIPVIKILLNPKLNNAIVFISLGMNFVLNYIIEIDQEFSNKAEIIETIGSIYDSIINGLESHIIIKEIIIKINKILIKKKIYDEELTEEINKLSNFCEEELFVNEVKSKLAKIGNDKNTLQYTMGEIEDAIYQSGNFQRTSLHSKIEKKKNTE